MDKADSLEVKLFAAEQKVEELTDMLKNLKDRQFGMSASYAEGRTLAMAAIHPEVRADLAHKALAQQLGNAILSSPFCSFNKRTVGDDILTTVNVTLFKPEKKGTKEGGN